MTYGQSHSYDGAEDAEEGYGRKSGTGSSFSSQSRPLVSMDFRNMIRFAVALPLVSFVFNIAYVLWTDFEEATSSVCTSQMIKVPNFLPSFSAVIGLFQFNQIVWNITVALHAAPRFLFTAMTFAHLKNVIVGNKAGLVNLVALLSLVESIALLIITYVSSTVNFPVHMWSFISFVLSSEAHMMLTCYLLEKHRVVAGSSLERRGLRYKWRLVCMNMLCAFMSFFAYYRHESHCEAGVYTIFAFLEYLVILTNMGFHGTAYYDFYDRKLRI